MLRQSILTSVAVTAVLGTVLFGAAGTIHWFGAELFLATIFGAGLTMQVWLARRDPTLARDRMDMRQTKPKAEKIALVLLNLLSLIWLALMGFDARWHGTAQLPAWANIAGAAAIGVGFLITMRVFAENTFATAIIKVQKEQCVIDTGPYAIVRHPMYGAVLLTYVALPFTLGSPRGLLGVPVLAVLHAVRTQFEENLLKRELPGYRDYMEKVRYRLVPFVW